MTLYLGEKHLAQLFLARQPIPYDPWLESRVGFLDESPALCFGNMPHNGKGWIKNSCCLSAWLGPPNRPELKPAWLNRLALSNWCPRNNPKIAPIGPPNRNPKKAPRILPKICIMCSHVWIFKLQSSLIVSEAAISFMIWTVIFKFWFSLPISGII